MSESIYECSVEGCKRVVAPGKKMCRRHLNEAAKKFMLHVAARKRVGQCIACEQPARESTRPSRTGEKTELRCKAHALANANKCAKWGKKNPGASQRSWFKKRQLRQRGFCAGCPLSAPTKLLPGENRCAACRVHKKYGFEVMLAAKADPQLMAQLSS